MKLRSVIPMRVAKYGYVLLALLFCAAGIALLVLPTPPLRSIGLFFGIALLAFGAVKLIGYFSRDLFRLAFQYDLQFGVVLCVLGVVTLIRRENAVEFLCIACGVCMIAGGMFRATIAFDARRFGISGWWLTLALALLGVALGTVVTFCPLFTARVVKALLGAALLTEGVLSLSVALSMVKIIDHQRPDVIDADFYEVWEDN